jgi:hypothetical protein
MTALDLAQADVLAAQEREKMRLRSQMACSFTVVPKEGGRARMVSSGELSRWRQVGRDLEAVLGDGTAVDVPSDRNDHLEGFAAAKALIRLGGA